MADYIISVYKEPLFMHPSAKNGKIPKTLKEVFVVFGDSHIVSHFCKLLGGKHYPYIKHVLTGKGIVNGWRVPMEQFDTFQEIIFSDDTYQHYVKKERAAEYVT